MPILTDLLALSEDEEEAITPFMDLYRSILSNAEFSGAIPVSSSKEDHKQITLLPPEAIFKYSSVDDQQKLQTLIEAIDLSLLIKLAIHNPEINIICTTQFKWLTDIWNEKWRQCGRNPRGKAKGETTIHEYLPQPTINTFELLKGIYFYSQYIKQNKINGSSLEKNAMEYLNLAAELGYFPALNALCIKSLENDSDHPKALFYAKEAARLHWTPGYLLLTVVHFTQGNYYEALEKLLIAEILIPHSQAIINNAYQGKKLEEIAAPLMKQLKVKNWLEAKQQLAVLADVTIHFVSTILHDKAQKEVTKLLQTVSKSNLDEDERKYYSQSL